MSEKTVSHGESTLSKVLKLAALAVVVVLCVLVIRPVLTNPETFQESIDYLNEKKQNAIMISMGSASASFIVSMIPDDTGTPIATELAKMSSYILFVISAILLEKYLLTAIGLFATCVIMPIACLCGAFAVLSTDENKRRFREFAIRFLVLAICIVQIIPIACICGQTIESANKASIDAAMEDAKNANEIVDSIPEEYKGKNIFEKVGEFFSGLWKSASDAYDWANTVLSNFLSSVSVMIVTTIAIPILILLFYIWIIHMLTRKDFTGSVITMVSGWFLRKKQPAENTTGEAASGDSGPENADQEKENKENIE